MLKKTFSVTILLVTICLSIAYAQIGGSMMGKEMMGMGMGMGMMSGGMAGLAFCIANADKLGISTEQLTKLKALHYEHKKTIITLNADKDLKQLELNELLNKEDPDLSVVESKLKDISAVDIKVKMEALKTHQEAKKILTKEQMQKMKELMADKMGQMKSGKGKKNMMMKGGMDEPEAGGPPEEMEME